MNKVQFTINFSMYYYTIYIYFDDLYKIKLDFITYA